MFQDSLTKKIAEAASQIKTEPKENEINEKSVEGAVVKVMNEKLVGDQHKIDANKNKKIDSHDFKLLRAQKEKEKANSQKFGKDVKEETEQVDEAMFPGTKEYEKKYGQSPQQKLKKKGDTVPTSQGEMKKTEKGVMHTRRFSEMLETYREGGLKTISEMLVKEEPSQEEFEKEIDQQKKRNNGEIRNDKGVAKPFQSASVREEPVNPVEEEVQEIEERSLTEPEMKKKEEIVKSMKKGMAGFKERYGKRAKEVMYATATARAKGE